MPVLLSPVTYRNYAGTAEPSLSFDAIDISFDAIKDPQERAYFMNLPTTFFLSDEAVDRLREVPGRLLRDSPIYGQVLRRIED